MLKIFYMLTFLFRVQNIWADSKTFLKAVFDENKDLWTSACTLAQPPLQGSQLPSPIAFRHTQPGNAHAVCSLLTLAQILGTYGRKKKRALVPWFPGIQLGCWFLPPFLLLLLLQLCFPQWPSLTFVKPPTHPLTNTTYSIFIQATFILPKFSPFYNTTALSPLRLSLLLFSPIPPSFLFASYFIFKLLFPSAVENILVSHIKANIYTMSTRTFLLIAYLPGTISSFSSLFPPTRGLPCALVSSFLTVWLLLSPPKGAGCKTEHALYFPGLERWFRS